MSAVRTSDGSSTPDRVEFVEEHDNTEESWVLDNHASDPLVKRKAEVQDIAVEALIKYEQPVVRQTVRTVRFPGAQ